MIAPVFDYVGFKCFIRINKADDIHYLASEKDGKKTKWTAIYANNKWEQKLKT